jgi:dsDNA-binding SOS-regulon protein
MIGLLIAVVFLTGKVLRLQMNFYVMKFQNMENESDSHNKFAEIDEVLQTLLQNATYIQEDEVEHNPLLDYRNSLLKTLTFKKAKIKNVGNFKAWYSDKQSKIINVAEDTISIVQDEDIYITDEGLYIHKDHVTLIK